MPEPITAMSPMELHVARQRQNEPPPDDMPEVEQLPDDPNPATSFRIDEGAFQSALEKDKLVEPEKPESSEVKPEAGKETPKVEEPPKAPEPEKVPKSRKDWDEYKAKKETEISTLRAQMQEKEAQWQKQIEEAKKAAPTAEAKPDPEAEQLRKEYAEMSERMRMLDLENHPRFKAYFGKQIEQQVATVKQLVGAANEAKVVEAMGMPDGEAKDQLLDELLEGIPMWKRGQVSASLLRISELHAEKSAELAKGKETYQRVMAMDKQEAEKAFTQSLAAARQQISVLQRKEGDAAHNAAIDNLEATAKGIFESSLGAPEKARLALWTAAAPVFLSQMKAMEAGKSAADAAHKAEVETLKAEIARLTAAKPDLSGGGKDTPTDFADDDPSAPMDQHSLMARAAKALGRTP